MPMTYAQALKAAARTAFTALGPSEQWRDIGNGMIAVLVQLIRLAILLSFPFSTPLIAWLIQLDERKTAVQRAEARERLLQQIHQNGRPPQ